MGVGYSLADSYTPDYIYMYYVHTCMYLTAEAPVQPLGNSTAQWVRWKEVEVEREHLIPYIRKLYYKYTLSEN